MSQAANSETTTATPRALRTPLDGLIIAIANRVGGNKAKEVERFLKFAIVGTLGAVVDFGVLNLLQATILPPGSRENPNGFTLPVVGLFIPLVAIAVTISFVCAILSNFTWNRYWTYPDSRTRSIRRQLTQFATVSVIGWLARTTWITLSYGFIGTIAYETIHTIQPGFILSEEGITKLGTNIALFIGIFVVMIWNFFANRYWTYNDVE